MTLAGSRYVRIESNAKTFTGRGFLNVLAPALPTALHFDRYIYYFLYIISIIVDNVVHFPAPAKGHLMMCFELMFERFAQ